MVNKKYKVLPLITAFNIFLIICFGLCNKVYSEEIKNIVIVGWDGTQRAHLKDLIKAEKVPNLMQVISAGSLVDIDITTGHTETKPGWTEILTGYRGPSLGIKHNFNYKPIPKSYTIFERFKEHFGKEKVKAIFIGGKENNIGFRGPHEICANCVTRLESHEKSYYWDKERIKTDKTSDGQPPRWVPKEGEPYFYTADSLEVHTTGLGPADIVGPEVLKALETYANDQFIAFFHFEDPDEMGHQFGENSREYDDAIQTVDQWLGFIIENLKQLGIYEKTLLVVASDHGMNEGKKNHSNAPETFLAMNSKIKLKLSGDRKDVTPTIYDVLGIDLAQFNPPLEGKSLLEK
jgi:predicted AlkP superfamily pyrophosphatase or phosphodiesterase